METTIKYQKENQEKDLLFAELREAVNNFLKENHLNKDGGWTLKKKAIILTTSWLIIYLSIIILSGTSPPWITYVLYGTLGINFALIGFNVMHDLSHGTFSKSKKLNNFLLFLHESFQGVSAFLWELKHVTVHHSNTNTEDDDDLSGSPALRLSPHDKRYWHHKYQAFYAIFFYGLLFFVWVFIGDSRKFLQRKIKNYKISDKKFTRAVKWRFVITKILFFVIMIIIPGIMIGWLKAIIGFLILCFVCGVFISTIFQLAHIVETSSFPKTTGLNPKKVNRHWSENQLIETSNFATKSKVATWLFGGLNFQVEHHLFPNISHIHYPKIAPLVKSICKKWNIPYNELSFVEAIKSHIFTLHRLGNFT